MPAIDRLRVVRVASHLFVFYFGMASTVEHPVCQAAIVGAVLGVAPMVQTGFQGMRLRILILIMVSIFLYKY